jgi:predicted Rossmann fold flavoprotein
MSAPLTRSPQVAIIGGGPAGLMAAETLAAAGAAVTVFERMPSAGRKLLLAGRGGLNITHSETLEQFLSRYGPAAPFLAPSIEAFAPDDLRAWCAGLGETPFVGSSGRVFPAGFRATPLLRAWLHRLGELGVEIRTRHTWRGWTGADGELAFVDADGTEVRHRPDVTVLAMGGASWPRTGSDGGWVPIVENAGIRVTRLRPANCGFRVAWSDPFRSGLAGMPLKNVGLSFEDTSVRGEAMVVETGIEGGGVYALSRVLRDALDHADAETETDAGREDLDASHQPSGGGRWVTLTVDLQPDLTLEQLTGRFARRRPKDSASTALRRAGLAPVAIGLLREVTGNRLPDDPAELARLAKAVPVPLVGVMPIDRAISTAGGIALDEVDEAFMLRRRPGTFVAGEMLDWEAPTGGYLLQATFSTAMAAARGAIGWLNQSSWSDTMRPTEGGTRPS